jgi:hypothetical protein
MFSAVPSTVKTYQNANIIPDFIIGIIIIINETSQK